MDATDERAIEAFDDAVAEPVVVQRVERRGVGLPEQIGRTRPGEPHALTQDAELVAQRADRGDDGLGCGGGPAERVADQMGGGAVPDDGARFESAEVECVDVELPIEFGVRGEEHLEPAVEAIAVDDVGANASADAVGCLEHDDVVSDALEGGGGGQSGEAGTDDHDVGRLGDRACVVTLVHARWNVRWP